MLQKLVSESRDVTKNVNKFKPAVSEWTKSVVSRNMSREIELYQWCRQRLNNQYNALVREGRI